MRVLYVDDDRINTLLFVECCRVTGGLELETAGTGAEALQVVAGWAPDLLVVDLHLPDTNGLDLLAPLRAAIGRTPGPPAVLCTADEGDEVVAAAQAAGFTDCWPKPVDRRRLADALDRLGSPRAVP